MGSAAEGSRQGAHGRTRDRILATALGLFNEEGVAKVSTNGIAAALGISPGNLYYHFRSKGQIADWLVRRFESRIAAFSASAESVAALDDVWLVLHLAFETIHEYRFIFRDISILVRESPALEQRVRQMTARGLVTAHRMCARLAQTSIIRAQREDLDSLALQIVFTATCWATFEKLLPQRSLRAADAGRAAYQVLTLLTPYLEPRSRAYLTYLRSKYALD